MKKQIILGMASLMAVGMLSTGTVFAAESEVPVSYDNRNAVGPEDPLAEWSVSIPTAVAFTKDSKTQKVDVELVPINGATLKDLTDDKVSVQVKVASTNGMKLKDSKNTEELNYAVTYDGAVDVTGTTAVKIADLTGAAAKKEGTATYDANNKPTQLTMYTDKLTYTITGGTTI